ncbi:MAG: hypothetical protein NWS01_00045 [Burkholderiales bacterium]|jgi:hypothetical protein|nr:hypothetical protein [Burkholderiales bacterium]
MSKIRLPWTLQGSDFSQPGWHTQPTTAYQLMFEFLLLSPSYELARKARTDGLSKEEIKQTPTDFDQVLATFDLLGDVNCILFRQWWLKRGLSVFGNPYTQPKLHQVALLDNGQETDIADISQKIKLNLMDQRESEGLSASLLVSLPLMSKRSEIIRQVRSLLDQYDDFSEYKERSPKIKIMGKRFHPNAMLKGLRLLWFKAAKPDWENWRLGAKARLSDSYSSVLDPKAPRRPSNPTEMDDRITMGKITYRSLIRFELIAENAARGRFPCAEPVASVEFKYKEIAQRLKTNSKWIKNYKANWRSTNFTNE